MPAPSDAAEFATDATYAADGDDWSGGPPRVDPGAAVRAEGFEPGKLPIEWLNHVLGVHGDWAAWLESERLRLAEYIGGAAGTDEWAYEAAKTRTKIFAYADLLLSTDSGAPCWDVADGGVNGPTVKPRTTTPRASAWASIKLPTGVTITAVRVLIGQVGGLASGNQWEATLEKQVNWDFVPANAPGRSILGSATESGMTAGAVVIAWTGLSEVVDNSDTTYHVHVFGPAVIGAADTLYGVEVTYSEPGPRP